MASPVIPVELDELTPEWLAPALGAAVSDVEVVERHSGTTGRARLVVASDDGRVPPSVFVKLAPFDERQRRFVDAVGLGVAEARFYRDLAPEVPVRVPSPLVATTDGARFVMVLEDLVASGSRFPSPDDADVGEIAGRVVDALAVLHARYRGRDLPPWVGDGARLAFEEGGPFIARARDRFADEMPPVFRRLAELYVAHAGGIAQLYRTGTPTLAHGDPHLGNLFVDGERPGFFDWGMVMARTGMWDVAYLLCGSIPTEIRRAHEREWIGRYLAGLAAAGAHLDAGTAWEQYRLFAVYAWSSATSTAAMGARWQPERIGLAGMLRSTVAVDDLDSVGLLERLLGARERR